MMPIKRIPLYVQIKAILWCVVWAIPLFVAMLWEKMGRRIKCGY